MGVLADGQHRGGMSYGVRRHWHKAWSDRFWLITQPPFRHLWNVTISQGVMKMKRDQAQDLRRCIIRSKISRTSSPKGLNVSFSALSRCSPPRQKPLPSASSPSCTPPGLQPDGFHLPASPRNYSNKLISSFYTLLLPQSLSPTTSAFSLDSWVQCLCGPASIQCPPQGCEYMWLINFHRCHVSNIGSCMFGHYHHLRMVNPPSPKEWKEGG